MLRPRAALVAAALVAVFGFPHSGSAQGWLQWEQSAAALGRGGAGAGAADDAAAAFHAPGGLAFAEATLLEATGGVTVDDGSFDLFGDGAFDREPSALPGVAVHAVHPIARNLVGGLSIATPWRMKVSWDDPSAFVGRFRSTETRLGGVSVSPVVAVRIHPRLGVAVGPRVVFATMQLDRFEQDPALSALGGLGPIDLARSRSDMDGLEVGWVGGIHARPRDGLDAALHVRGPMDVELTGRTDFSVLAPADLRAFELPGRGVTVGEILEERFADVAVRATLPLPATVTFGAAWRPFERVRVLADLQWADWSEADRLVLVPSDALPGEPLVRGWRDAWTLRAGAEVRHGERALVRIGFARVGSPARLAGVTPFLPDADRTALSAGLAWPWGVTRVDVGYRLSIFQDRRGVAFPENRTTADGVFEGHEHRLAVSVLRTL